MTEEKARNLLSLYLKQGCTPAEKLELFRWINESGSDELQQVLQDVWADFVPSDSIDDDNARRMLSEILSHENAVKPNHERRIGPVWKRWAAAAAILVTVGSLTYYSLNSSKVVTGNNASQV